MEAGDSGAVLRRTRDRPELSVLTKVSVGTSPGSSICKHIYTHTHIYNVINKYKNNTYIFSQ